MPLKIMMVEGRYKGEVDLSGIKPKDLPQKLGLISTVQFLDQIEEIKSALEKAGKEVFTNKLRQKYDTQLLGCDQGAAMKDKDLVDAYFYFGTGVFHPLGVVIAAEKDVYCYDPLSGIQTKIPKEQGIRMNKKRKGAYLAFLSAKNVGLLVSIKPGQNLFKKAVSLKERHPEKNCYIFVQDTLDFNQIENFPFVDVWINTACNRIMDDAEKFPKPLIDIADIEKAEQSALLSVKI
jgi:2-(3-amino-3-carboxypropyl)histidine synthase